jgi:methylated-DNA-[protein]-cysteine S-methyltransferase
MVKTPTVIESVAFSSPLGRIVVGVSELGISRVSMRSDDSAQDRAEHPWLRQASDELKAFFAGHRGAFTVPLDLSSGSDFERRVWNTLRTKTMPGELLTYGRLASLAGSPGGARAIGRAMGCNPVPIFVPCHRVIAAGGRPGGFGGGLDLKSALLGFEGTELPGIEPSLRAAGLPMQSAAR